MSSACCVEIERGLFLGSMEASQPEILSEYGIRCVLNAALKEDSYIRDNDHTLEDYLVLGLDDSWGAGKHLERKIPDVCEFLQKHLRRKTPVLVHCSLGRSRSVAVIIAWLIRERGMTCAEALNLVRTKRPKANPNHGFMMLLQKL